MRKATLFALALVLIAAAVFLAVAYDGNSANAVPGGWDATFCGGCHNGGSGGVAPPAHTVSDHSGIMGNCANCHSQVPAINLDTCVGCHTAAGIVNAHPAQSCAGDECHGAVTTTTVAPTTTTVVAPTTTTVVLPTTTTQSTTTTTVVAPTTTTTVKPTTTTQSTTTTVKPTTTTVPSGSPTYTG